MSRTIRKVLGIFTTKTFIDIWCFVALIRFATGLHIDSVTLGIILGAYTTHRAVQQMKGGQPNVV